MRKKGTYRFVATDTHGEKRCWVWSSTRKMGEIRIRQAIREFIRMEGPLYGKLDEWAINWELRGGEKDDREYLPKPVKKPSRYRKRNTPDEPAV